MQKLIRHILIASFLGLAINTQVNAETDFGIEGVVPQSKIKIPRIDSENFEVGAYIGGMNIENFGSSLSSGAFINVHATDEFFFIFSLSQATVNDEVFARVANTPILGDQREVPATFTNVSIAYSLFPGEIYLGKNRVFSSDMYLMLGGGSVSLLEEEYFTLVFGFGLKVYPVDWLSIQLESRGIEYESRLLGQNKTSHNFELSSGIGVYF